MMDDFPVSPRSARQIEDIALAWRHALGVGDTWAPDMVSLVESELPKLLPTPFALVVRDDAEMDGVEAYTEFNPAHIAVRASVYTLARKFDGRSRMTFAHELGHLVMHVSDGPRPRALERSRRKLRFFESAEWQANKFASLFLLPEHVVRQFSSVDELVAGCRVSRQAAEIRFNEVGHIKKHVAPCVGRLSEELEAVKPPVPKPKLVPDPT